MARKVFISFLGTTPYIECHYQDGESPAVRFVQEALIRNTCKKWQPTDRILIFCTQEAEKKNWLDGGQPRAVTDKERQGLQTRLKELQQHGLKASVEMVPIKEGYSEEDVWNIFSTVYDHLEPEDQIYFDVTHAFRSIPIFSVVLFNFSKFMKDTRIVSIKYGAFEALGNPAEVIKMPLEIRIAPVLDLTNIARLQEYNQLASDLAYYGKVYGIGDTIYDENDTMVRDLANSIADLEDYITSLKFQEIREGAFVKDFLDCLEVGIKFPRPIQQLLERLKEEMSKFVPADSFLNIEAAIEWAKKYNMLMQAYALAVEYVKSFVAEPLYEESRYKNQLPFEDFSLVVTSLLGMSNKDFRNRNWERSLSDCIRRFGEAKRDIVKNIANGLVGNTLIIALRQEVSGKCPYRELNYRRNKFLHADGEFTYDDLDKDFYPLYEQSRDILHDSEYWIDN